MSLSTPRIEQSDLYGLRYAKTVLRDGRDVLVAMFKWSYPRGTTKPIKEYLFQSEGYSNNRYRKDFDSSQRERLDRNDPVETFDVTLLCKLLRLVCGLSQDDRDWVKPPNPNVENCVHRIKGHRNGVCHEDIKLTEQEMKDKLHELQNLFVSALSEAETRFQVAPVEVSQLQDTVKRNIKAIIDQKIHEPLSACDIDRLRQEMKEIREALTDEVLQKCREELKQTYELECQVNFASWLLYDDQCKPSAVFTNFIVIPDKVVTSAKHQQTQLLKVSYRKILQAERIDKSKPDIFILSGEGGMGKTTYLRYILEQWIEDQDHIVGLKDFDLVLHVECRNRFISTFDELLRHLLHQTYPSVNIDFKYFRDITLHFQILFLIDGYDECNDASQKLIQEILDLPGNNVKIIFTSRSVSVDEITRLVDFSSRKKRLNLVTHGIANEYQTEFIYKHIDVLLEPEEQDKAKQCWQINYKQLSQQLGESLNSPLILILITLMIRETPDKLGLLTTATELYDEVKVFIREKLIQRLVSQGRGREGVLRKRYEDFCHLSNELALHTFASKEFELKNETISKLKLKCDELDLPQEEVLSAHFTIKRTRSGLSLIDKIYSPHHSRELEFNGAHYIVQSLYENKGPKSDNIVKEILGSVTSQEASSSSSTSSLEKYDNVLVHVTGLLQAHHENLLQKYASSIIDLVHWDGNVIDPLLKHIVESKNNPRMTEVVMSKLDIFCWETKGGNALLGLKTAMAVNIPSVLLVRIEGNPKDDVHLLQGLSVIVQYKIRLCLIIPLHLITHHADHGVSDRYLREVTTDSNCSLEWFQGGLTESGIHCLPTTLRRLWLRLEDSKEISALAGRLQHLDQLNVLNMQIYLSGEWKAESMSTFHGGRSILGLYIDYLSCVDDNAVENVCLLLSKLCPPHRKGHYDAVIFWELTFSDNDGYKRLLQSLNSNDVSISSITLKLGAKKLSDQEKEDLKTLATSLGIGDLEI